MKADAVGKTHSQFELMIASQRESGLTYW